MLKKKKKKGSHKCFWSTTRTYAYTLALWDLVLSDMVLMIKSLYILNVAHPATQTCYLVHTIISKFFKSIRPTRNSPIWYPEPYPKAILAENFGDEPKWN